MGGVKLEFMREALRLARENLDTGQGGPFGAVIVKGDEIVARGRNRVTPAFDPTAHAEIEAIRAAGQVLRDFSLKGCEIYASCEPCPMCLAACHWARLDRVYYAASRWDAAEAGFDDAELYRGFGRVAVGDASGLLPMRGVLPDEGREVLRLWRTQPDRVPY